MELITEAKIKQNTAITTNVDSKLIMPYLEQAQLLYIKPLLGVALYSELETQSTSGTAGTALYSELNMKLISKMEKALAWASYFEAFNFIAFQTTNSGVIRRNSSSVTPLSIEELKDLRENVRKNVTYWLNEVKNYLNANALDYPLYRAPDCDDGVNHRIVYFY